MQRRSEGLFGCRSRRGCTAFSAGAVVCGGRARAKRTHTARDPVVVDDDDNQSEIFKLRSKRRGVRRDRSPICYHQKKRERKNKKKKNPLHLFLARVTNARADDDDRPTVLVVAARGEGFGDTGLRRRRRHDGRGRGGGNRCGGIYF